MKVPIHAPGGTTPGQLALWRMGGSFMPQAVTTSTVCLTGQQHLDDC